MANQLKQPKKLTFAQLKKEWYDKLKDSGFNDIEQDADKLKRWDVSWFSNRKYMVDREARKMYYDLASKFLNEFKFKTELERIIWEYHTNGLSARNIALLLNDTKIVKTNKDYINRAVKQLAKQMKEMYLVNYDKFDG